MARRITLTITDKWLFGDIPASDLDNMNRPASIRRYCGLVQAAIREDFPNYFVDVPFEDNSRNRLTPAHITEAETEEIANAILDRAREHQVGIWNDFNSWAIWK